MTQVPPDPKDDQMGFEGGATVNLMGGESAP